MYFRPVREGKAAQEIKGGAELSRLLYLSSIAFFCLQSLVPPRLFLMALKIATWEICTCRLEWEIAEPLTVKFNGQILLYFHGMCM